MNIIYATRATIPYPSAASLNTVQMCQSLVDLGHDVTLAIGRKFWRRTPRVRNWADYYGCEVRFHVSRHFELPRVGWWFDRQIVQRARTAGAVLYARYIRVLEPARKARVPCLLEVHSGVSKPDRMLVRSALSDGTLRGIVTITRTLREDLLNTPELEGYGDRIGVAPDAVAWRRFLKVPSASCSDRVGYVGGLFPGKGMEQIVALARRLPHVPIEVFGGRPCDIRDWSRRALGLGNLQMHGHIAPIDVPACMARFGIALLPNQPHVRLPNGDDIGRYTSPMKLFEYMAAGRAIVASDLPPLREVLTHEHNCLLVPPDDTAAWVDAVERLRADVALRQRLADRAREQAQQSFSYETRFRNILFRFFRELV